MPISCVKNIPIRTPSQIAIDYVVVIAALSSVTPFASADMLVATSGELSILRHDENTGNFISPFTRKGFQPTSIVVALNGNILGLNSQGIHEYHWPTGELLGRFNSDSIESAQWMRFGPDGNLFVRAAGAIKKLDGKTGDFISDLVLIDTNIFSEQFTFGPEGDIFAIVGSFVTRYDGRTGDFIELFTEPIPVGFGATGLVFGPGGNRGDDLYVIGGFPGIHKFNGETGEFLETFATDQWFNHGAIGFGLDENLYVLDNQLGRMLRFESSSGDFIDEFSSINGSPRDFLFIAPAFSGDANGDRVVDFFDAVLVVGNLDLIDTGATWRQGDFDSDGDVDFFDLVLLVGNLQASETAAVVPEPSGIVLALMGLVGLVTYGWHRQRHSV